MNLVKLVLLWLWNILVWIDQGANVIFAPLLNVIFYPAKFGDPDETLSSVFSKHKHECKLCMLTCRLLHLFDRDHCDKSTEHDEGGNALRRDK